MRGYHIRISLKLKAGSNQPSSSQAFTSGSVFDKLPAQTPKPTARQNALYNPRNKDYRFGPIRLDWVDFEMSDKTAYSAGKAREYSREPAAATFIPTKHMESGSTNLPEGTVHLFREGTTSSSDEHLKASSSSVKSDFPEFDGVMLGVLAVPSWMAPSDFLAFVAPAAEGITHLRIIRDSVPNRSIVVIKFSDRDHASEFAEAYNGKPFNSMEPEICHVVRVLSVTMDAEDPALSRLASTLSELPTCPVCLERMDSGVTGLITVPCSHTFHCMCLSKWGDSRCPVCRYSQTLMSSHPGAASSTRSIPFANPSAPTLSACSSCASTTNLWICLICGNIGCGRYGRAHAQAHYQSTTHLYALELETQRVWDYAGDGYVHRLIQNKADGKLVELPSASSSMGANPRDGGLGPGPADALSAEKIEAIGIEYSYLLTSQLDSQRAYYEEQTDELKTQVGELRGILERLSSEFEKDKAAAKEEIAQRQHEEETRMASLAKDKTKAESRTDKLMELARRLEKELSAERAVSEGLMKNLGKAKERVEQSEKDKADTLVKMEELQDQLRDVMFYLEAKTKIEQGGGVEAEAAGGSIEVGEPPKSSAKKKKKKGATANT